MIEGVISCLLPEIDQLGLLTRLEVLKCFHLFRKFVEVVKYSLRVILVKLLLPVFGLHIKY
jgi:hypothetical protein